VELSVLRVRKPEPTKVTLTRVVVKYPPLVSKMLPDGIGYVQAQSMEPGKVKEISRAVTDLEKQGAKKLILDVRNSTVGPPEEGVALANLFLDKGLITYLQGQRISRQDFQADPAKTVAKIPMVVMTNRGTASAAEVAAAALLDNKRAQVVGERTYGDAAVRKPITMDDGSAVILSVAKYFSPGGKAIQDTGVTPTVPVQDIEPSIEGDDDPTPERPEPQQKPGEDPVLKKAIETLTGGTTKVEGQPVAAAPKDDRDPSAKLPLIVTPVK
jgi:carboxyl-terminal processing protease